MEKTKINDNSEDMMESFLVELSKARFLALADLVKVTKGGVIDLINISGRLLSTIDLSDDSIKRMMAINTSNIN